jgi:DNA repair and recombination protein RAD54B
VAGLRALKCQRRVLLSGTPIQNDLGEFFAVGLYKLNLIA